MPDREKVIKAYEDFINGYECFCTSDDYEYEMHKAVLAMLKEQKFFVDESGKITPLPIVIPNCPLKEYEVKAQISDAIHETAKQFRQTIVRCKDCKRYPDCCRPPRDDPNWFCADGEAKS